MIEYFRVLFLRNPKIRFIIVVSEQRAMTIARVELVSIRENTLNELVRSRDIHVSAFAPVRTPIQV